MVLDSLPCKSSLHKLGQNTIRDFSHGSAIAQHFQIAETPDQEPTIPSPAVFNFDKDTHGRQRGDTHRLPLVASCAAHLELLEVFYLLRQKILASEDIDRACDIKPVRETKTGARGDTKTLRDKTLWTRRQQKWTHYLEFAAVRFLVWRDALRRDADGMVVARDDGTHTLVNLPPIDVLMVWHAFMLNPRLFAQTCKEEVLYGIRMPWKAVHERIENRTWVFGLTAAEESAFGRITGLSTDLYDQFATWIPEPEKPTVSNLGLLTKALPVKPAKPAANRPKLGAFSFERGNKSTSTIHALLPPPAPSPPVTWTETDLKYKSLFDRTDVDLAKQLRDAVDRQTAFVDKMNKHMWIRSPALVGTLTRAVSRYGKFLDLMRRYPKVMVVPTLDIDLAWHTHQCAAAFYARGVKAVVGRFVNHDDSIAEAKLGTGFDDTLKVWRVHYGTQYRLCRCWDCEALQSALDEAMQGAGREEDVDMEAVARGAREEVTYYRAVEVAIRTRKPLPIRPSA
ncbi:hypothetical protein JDV02_003364 [Purpureocillium takamizusanense]|uniref:Uncharacterized protein n=1 Tax=Purpureocillium takamizusanense TaxID=2060973 RepID=A0A9Q8V9P0_9HYPO|nr:uncharacterized protein JDV02_003364 [Purpureocillium takamizusanense]UNI16982.1 hypothetical protein JDV02_003364 [Purpureocillium takamizusanense]